MVSASLKALIYDCDGVRRQAMTDRGSPQTHANLVSASN